MRPRSSLLGAVALLLAAAPPATSQASAQARSRERALAVADSIWSDIETKRTAAGMAVAVVRGRDTVLWKGYGLADIENDVPVSPDHIFEIGSITKQFTSAALLKLVEQGKIALDSSITAYLPGYPLQGHRVTVRQLLDHTSGIRSYTSVPKFGTLMVRDVPRDTLVASFRDEPFDFAPGTQLLYNNSGYYLAGLVIEKAAGKPYEAVVREMLFEPLGLKATSYCDPRRVVKRRATGYDYQGSIVRAQYIDMAHPYSAGALCSTVGDLAAWNAALHGGRVLSAESYREMTTPRPLADGTPTRYAMGIVSGEVAGRRALHHGGDIPGFSSYSAYFPEDSASVVVLVNTLGPARPDPIAERIARAALPAREARAPAKVPTSRLARLVGSYAYGERKLEITIAGDTLKAQMGGQRTLALLPRADGSFYAGASIFHFAKGDGPPARVWVDGTGTVLPFDRK